MNRSRRWCRRILQRLRQCRQSEDGAVLAIVAILMVPVFIPLAALAVDVGSYYQAQRSAQAAADAGALAGSQDLPTVATATTDANSYALKNYPGATVTVTTPYNSNANQVQVTVTASTPTFFGKFMGFPNRNVSATAVAALTPGASNCTIPGSGCAAIFAMDQSACTSNEGIFFSGGGYTINGTVHSNSAFTATGGGNTFGPTTYGTGTGCLNTTATLPLGSGPEAAILTYPVPYLNDFPACGGTGIACNASGTPSFCSASAASYTFSAASPPSSGYIYCAYGTTTTKSNPATWNGTITFSGGAIGSSISPVVASYVAGNVFTGSGGNYFAACGYSSASGYSASTCKGSAGQTMPAPSTYNYPLIYTADTPSNVPLGETYAVNLGGGGNTWQGDIFAPVGDVVVAAGSQTTGFIEAYDIGFEAGGIFNGDGPSGSGTTPSSEALVQ